MPGGPELIIILVVVLVLFGGSQLPKLAKNLGKAQKEFKDGVGEGADASTAQPPAAPPAPTAQPPAPPSSAMPPPPPPAAPQQ
jgi:sec-independent protein translocase protein TatA